MKQSFSLPGNKFEVLDQLKSFQTPLEKIDYLEVLAHDMRDKLDWMKSDEASREPGNELEFLKRNDSLSAEAQVKRQLKALQTEHRKELQRRRKLAWIGFKRLPFPVVWDQDSYLEWEASIEGKHRKHDWCLWLRQGLVQSGDNDWCFKDTVIRQARLDALDKGETDDEILWYCLSIDQGFVDFLEIQKINPITQAPGGRGKKATPELHKVIWRAYRYVCTSLIENPSAQEVWNALKADPMMFDPESIVLEDSLSDDKFFYLLPNLSEPKSYKRLSLDTRLSLLKKNPPKI